MFDFQRICVFLEKEMERKAIEAQKQTVGPSKKKKKKKNAEDVRRGEEK